MAAPMLLMLTTGLLSSSSHDYECDRRRREEERKRNQQKEEDMAKRPMVTIDYDEYHDMQTELQMCRDMRRKNSVAIRKPGTYEWKEFFLVKPVKAVQEIKEMYDEVYAENARLKKVVEAHERYIDHLENRGFFARIINKLH